MLCCTICARPTTTKGTRNVKNDATGQWEKVPSYSVVSVPYGHGEEGVFLIERFMKLKGRGSGSHPRYMGGFDDAAKGGCFAISRKLTTNTRLPSSSTLPT